MQCYTGRDINTIIAIIALVLVAVWAHTEWVENLFHNLPSQNTHSRKFAGKASSHSVVDQNRGKMEEQKSVNIAWESMLKAYRRKVQTLLTGRMSTSPRWGKSLLMWICFSSFFPASPFSSGTCVINRKKNRGDKRFSYEGKWALI